MKFIPCFSLPGGAEWILIGIVGFLLLAAPIAAILYYSKVKTLERENRLLRLERDEYQRRLNNKGLS
jgi:hypothetical protein